MSLAAALSEMIEGCTAFHDPDVFRYGAWSENFYKMKLNGVFKMTLGRILTNYSIDLLGMHRIRSRKKDQEIVGRIRRIRSKLLAQIRTRAYLESNNQLRGVIDLLPAAFPDSKAVFIIRDPRDWVRSWLNKFIPRYSRRDLRGWLPHARLTPRHVPGDPWRDRWKKMSVFEKLCWAWHRENVHSLACVLRNPNAMVVRFEDLFAGEAGKGTAIESVLDFATRSANGRRISWVKRPELLERKLHATANPRFPEWPYWTEDQIVVLMEHCGDLMDAFDYGREAAWARMTQTAMTAPQRTSRCE